MSRAGMAMLLGMLALLWFRQLPPAGLVVSILLPLTLLLALRRETRFLLFAVFGFAWVWLAAQQTLDHRLIPQLEGGEHEVSGWVASIPQPEPDYLRFRFEVESLDGRAPGDGVPAQLRLTWSGHHSALAAGQHWRFTVRLKRPRGYMNPGGFDYEGWLFQQGIGATGYVRHNRAVLLPDAPRYPLLRARAAVSVAIKSALAGSEFAGVAAALAVGDTSGITQAQWQVFRDTGTAHLVAISGLNIGLLAGLVYLLTRLLWRRSAWLCERLPAPLAASVAAMLMACVYAAMAGFSVPTERALIMVVAVTGAVLWRRGTRWQDLLGLALLVVLLWQPFSAYSIGLWLSFGAVAAILYVMGARPGLKSGWLRDLLRTQWAVGVGLLPLLVFFFHRTALVAPLANLVAVPVYGVLVPLILVGTLLLPLWHGAGVLLLKLAALGMSLSWKVLDYLAALPHAQLAASASGMFALAMAGLGAVWLLAPRGIPARWLGVMLLLPLFVPGSAAIPARGFDLVLLDVGQGLSAVIRTAHHTLIYDTGPAFSPQSDTVKLVLLPWMQARGVGRPDLVMVSHEDNDHAGGLPRLRAAFPGIPVLSGAVGRFPDTWSCIRGQHWRWDGVNFEVLYPDSAAPAHGNDASCVLRISGAGGSALLVGDLMRKGERRLLALQADGLSAQVLVAPHHGSNSSSSPAFVRAVAPALVLFPVGYRNRWHFPKPEVAARYRAAGAALADSVHDGALRVSFRPGRQPVIAGRWRMDAARVWTLH
ncbi:MAG TPA: DNA internalization-related competence protein ComEC/Rec2 [Gammaproteobacteria bacterium]|nr:DNA internalization-related competence protein ComEC/Rec2 [Gammaproteobacteria bacterium]